MIALPPLPRLMARFVMGLFALALAVPAAQAFESRARNAWVYDVSSGIVLLDKDADVPVPPASMSKLMTLNMLFEALRDKRVTLQTTFAVSPRATQLTREGGSTMFLNEMDRPTVDDLIHGIIINSGNDACVVVAEGLAGSEDEFARKMTDRARDLGMMNSHFVNASGMPDPGQRMSMHDLGILATRLIKEFPEFYPMFSKTEFNYKDRAPANAHNRNPLLKISGGDWTADGMKTGHTSEAGYGMVGSAVMGDRRVLITFAGTASDKERADEAQSLMNWAFRQFTPHTVLKAGATVAEAQVWLGSADRVALVPAADVRLLLPSNAGKSIAAEVTYRGPLLAPIAKGTELAELVIHVPDLPDTRVPLVAAADVGKAGLIGRMMTAAHVLVSGRGGDVPAPSN